MVSSGEGIHSAYPWILLVSYAITIAAIVHDYEVSEDSWSSTTKYLEDARAGIQNAETVFASVSLSIAAIGGFLGWYFEHREFLLLAFVTNMSLASTMRVDNWLVWETGVLRFFSAASSLVAAWASLVKSNGLQQHRRKRVADSDIIPEMFTRATLEKLSVGSLFFVFAFGVIKLIFYHFVDSVGGDNKYSQVIYDDARHGTFLVLIAIVGSIGVTQIEYLGRMPVIFAATSCWIYVQMSNALLVYYGFGAETLKAICDCDVMSAGLDCPKVENDERFSHILMYMCWLSTMAAGYFLYLLSERVQGGADAAGGGGDTQTAWYGHGNHHLARHRGFFQQAISIMHTLWFGVCSMTIVFAVVLGEIHTRNGDCSDSVKYTIEAVVFGAASLLIGATHFYSTDRTGAEGKSLHGYSKINAAALVLVLFSASLLNHQISGAHTRATWGDEIADNTTGPVACPPFSADDFATCFGGAGTTPSVEVGQDCADSIQAHAMCTMGSTCDCAALTANPASACGTTYSAFGMAVEIDSVCAATCNCPGSASTGPTTEIASTVAPSELCQSVMEYARTNPNPGSRNSGEKYVRYHPAIEDMWHAASVSHWIGLILAIFLAFALEGLAEANEDYTTEFGTLKSKRQSVLRYRNQGSIVEYSAELTDGDGAVDEGEVTVKAMSNEQMMVSSI
jgi:hypothetical protein